MTYNHSYKAQKPKKILLECGNGTGSRTFTSVDEAPFQLAHVTLDTTCLDKSEVLIKFSSIVNMERFVDGATVRLKYELFRIYKDEEPKSLGTWMFEEIDVDANSFEVQEESFSFIFCDCITCLGCSNYFVTVIPVEIDGARAVVSNGRMAALAQPLCNFLEDEDKNFTTKYKGTESKQKHPNPKEIILTCGRGNGSIILREESEIEPPFEIAHLTLDTTYLNKPKALIEFSS
ncbi:MAG: DUF4489 domain-containing protein, partial [Opitutales bacterium]|nr:DUF4489 domain-containing protein [Opitutales bacterium]